MGQQWNPWVECSWHCYHTFSLSAAAFRERSGPRCVVTFEGWAALPSRDTSKKLLLSVRSWRAGKMGGVPDGSSFYWKFSPIAHSPRRIFIRYRSSCSQTGDVHSPQFGDQHHFSIGTIYIFSLSPPSTWRQIQKSIMLT